MADKNSRNGSEGDVLREIEKHNVLEKIIEELSRLIEKNETNLTESRN